MVILLFTLAPWNGELRAEEAPSSIVEKFDDISPTPKQGHSDEAVNNHLLSEGLRLYGYGYLEASYIQNFNNPSNRINELRIFRVGSNQPRFNLAQFVLRRDALAHDDWRDRIGFKVKFNAGQDSLLLGGKDF
ncbi:MAG: hypothetical protein JSS38_16385 [Nitrospira sp.]|nr:hypothetical protein [Nitrospira sp.]